MSWSGTETPRRVGSRTLGAIVEWTASHFRKSNRTGGSLHDVDPPSFSRHGGIGWRRARLAGTGGGTGPAARHHLAQRLDVRVRPAPRGQGTEVLRGGGAQRAELHRAGWRRARHQRRHGGTGDVRPRRLQPSAEGHRERAGDADALRDRHPLQLREHRRSQGALRSRRPVGGGAVRRQARRAQGGRGGGGASQTMLGGLKAGKFDAIMAVPEWQWAAEGEGFGKAIYDVQDEKAWNRVFGGPIAVTVGYVLRETIEKSPDLVQAYVNAIYHAQQWIRRAKDDEIVDLVWKPYMDTFKREDILRSVKYYKTIFDWDLMIQDKDYDNGIKVWVPTAVDKPIPYAKAVDMSFV